MRRVPHVLTALVLLAVPALAVPPTYEAIRDARPDGRTLAVDSLVLERDVFTFRLGPGTLHFLAPAGDRTFGAVWIGPGTMELKPATEGERRYLAQQMKRKDLDVLQDSFDRAVFLFADVTWKELQSKGTISTGQPDSHAASVFSAFAERRRNKAMERGLSLRLYAALTGSTGIAGGPFVAWMDGKPLPPSLVVVDPAGAVDTEESALIVLQSQVGGAWYSSHLKSEIASGSVASCRSKAIVDADHYAIDVRIRKNQDLEGDATVRFRSLVNGLVVLPFALDDSLRITSAARVVKEGDADREVPVQVIQEKEDEGGSPALVFSDALRGGEEAIVRVRYAGDKVLRDVGDDVYLVGSRMSWYPNLNPGLGDDLATFDLTYHVPGKRQVISVGKLVDTRSDGKETVTVWRADKPIRVAGFNYGTFKTVRKKEPVSGVEVQVCATKDLVLDDAMADASNSLQVYAKYFGPAPTDHIAVTQQAQLYFGQSWPGLIYLPSLSEVNTTDRQALVLSGSAEFVDQVGLHEMAHQWWGHRVGPETYRDEWLSEGFSEFSAALVLQMSKGSKAYDDFWESRRRALVEVSAGSVTRSEDAGPIALGWRVETDRARSAHQAVVYGKGAYVLHMLRAMMREKGPEPDKRFFDLLRDFVTTYDGRNATTEDFKHLLEEKHMVPEINATRDGKMDWFFDEWVYGTEIPRYETRFEIEQAEGGKYHVHGTVTQSGVSDKFLALVPLYFEMGKGQYLAFARAPFRGTMTKTIDTVIALPDKPKRVVANVQHEVLAEN